ncbi:hypothetical protein BC941DRAFT_466775 [Chlamydoabsidia padenii]|nr:hypothetical protein BC941DRAFT_466775 [Chlamydoabsidia padenii]
MVSQVVLFQPSQQTILLIVTVRMQYANQGMPLLMMTKDKLGAAGICIPWITTYIHSKETGLAEKQMTNIDIISRLIAIIVDISTSVFQLTRRSRLDAAGLVIMDMPSVNFCICGTIVSGSGDDVDIMKAYPRK